MPTVLVMLSGGLDSLGCLYKILTSDEYRGCKIHVHHLHLKNIENRAVAESIAVKNILTYFKDKDLTYTESMHVYPVINNHFIYDIDICAFIAGTICQCDPDIQYIAMGLTLLDESQEFKNRFLRYLDILKATLPKDQILIYPVMYMTKKQVYDSLPADLRVLAWSCRTPSYINNNPIPCGQCKTCRSLDELRS